MRRSCRASSSRRPRRSSSTFAAHRRGLVLGVLERCLAAESASRWVSSRSCLGAGLDAHGVRGGDGLAVEESGAEPEHEPGDRRSRKGSWCASRSAARRGPQDGYACSGEDPSGSTFAVGKRCARVCGARPYPGAAVRAPSIGRVGVKVRTRSQVRSALNWFPEVFLSWSRCYGRERHGRQGPEGSSRRRRGGSEPLRAAFRAISWLYPRRTSSPVRRLKALTGSTAPIRSALDEARSRARASSSSGGRRGPGRRPLERCPSPGAPR